MDSLLGDSQMVEPIYTLYVFLASLLDTHSLCQEFVSQKTTIYEEYLN